MMVEMIEPKIGDEFFTGFESDHPYDGQFFNIISIDNEIKDEEGNVGWSVTCDDGISYDCFYSMKLNIFVYALETWGKEGR